MFPLTDANNDGAVTFDELLIGMSFLKAETEAEKAAFFFDRYDSNKDGLLSQTELVPIAEHLVQRVLSSAADKYKKHYQQNLSLISQAVNNDIRQAIKITEETRDKLPIQELVTGLVAAVRTQILIFGSF